MSSRRVNIYRSQHGERWPFVGTMSFDTAGRTMMGLTSQGWATLAEKLPQVPLAFGANCGVGASDLLRTVLGFSAQAPDLPVVAKGNAGIPKYVDGHIHYLSAFEAPPRPFQGSNVKIEALEARSVRSGRSTPKKTPRTL